jgi:hypothetical protein
VDDELRCYIEAIEKRFDALRLADREAVALAHADLSRRLEGFPQQFATKGMQEEASKALQRLEKDSLSREIYEQNHKALADLVLKLDREKLPESVFETFVSNYRIEQENAATERRAVASALATSTERRRGAAGTWKQIAAVISLVLLVLSFVVSLVVLFANGRL